MQVQIVSNPGWMHKEVYVWEDQGDKRIFHYVENGHLMRYEVSVFELMPEKVKPFMVIPMQFEREIMAAFVEEASNVRMSTRTEAEASAKLEATEKHLADAMEIRDALMSIFIKKSK